MSKVLMSKVKHSNLKVVDQQHQEPVRREDELESCKLTPAEITDRTREIRSILENFLDGLAGVPFDVVADEPGQSIRDGLSVDAKINTWGRGGIGVYTALLAERLNPLIKRDYESCHEELAKDPVYDRGAVLWEMRRNLAETTFAVGVLFGAMVHGASDREIDRLERGLVHATVSRYGQVKKE